MGWAWHHDRFESNGGNFATALAQLKPVHPGRGAPAEALVHLLQTRQSSISWIKSPGGGPGMVEWSINGMGRNSFVFAVKACFNVRPSLAVGPDNADSGDTCRCGSHFGDLVS